MNCSHMFKRRPYWWLHRVSWHRWKCVKCGYLTRSYDVVDAMALRPIHTQLSVAYQGYNTTK